MESVGEFFRQVRETKGLTIDEVASKTRIRSDFVKALEEGNFAKLPDQVFARGFVRSYARSLGLDEEDAIHRFVQSAGAFYDKQEERERLKLRQAEEDRRRRANRKAVGVAIGVAVVTLVVLLSREQSSIVIRRATSEPPPPVTKKTTTSPKETQVSPPAAQTPSASPATTENKPADPSSGQKAGENLNRPAEVGGAPSESASTVVPEAPSVAAPGAEGPLAGLSLDGGSGGDNSLVLDLEATELSWVVVQIDGGSPQEALLRPGEKARWKAQDQFTLTLGNAGGVRAELNGKPQKPFGPSGKVARDVVLKR